MPFGTLYKIAVGETTNPGIETTRRFYGVACSWAATTAQETRDAA